MILDSSLGCTGKHYEHKSKQTYYVFTAVTDYNLVKLVRCAQRWSRRGKDLTSNSNHST